MIVPVFELVPLKIALPVTFPLFTTDPSKVMSKPFVMVLPLILLVDTESIVTPLAVIVKQGPEDVDTFVVSVYVPNTPNSPHDEMFPGRRASALATCPKSVRERAKRKVRRRVFALALIGKV